MYSDNRTTMLNKFHVWFPGGIVIGALATTFLNSIGLGMATENCYNDYTYIDIWLYVFQGNFPKV